MTTYRSGFNFERKERRNLSYKQFSSSTFLQGDPFLGILRTLDLLSPLLITLMVRFLPKQMLVLSLHTLQGEYCLWQGGAAHSGEFGCKYLTMISTPSHLESGTICVSVFPTQQNRTQNSAGPKRHRSVECVQVFWPCDFEFTSKFIGQQT
ncbi:unnamed protein product [Prunus armeniaca]